MPTLEIKLYRYSVVDGKVTAVSGLQTLAIEDQNGDGLIGQKEIAAYFFTKGHGHLWGSSGTDADRDATFTVGETGNLKNYTLFTTTIYKVGDKVDTSGLVQNFKPFNPGAAGVPCFAADSLIETARGAVAAGDLVVGDLVRTRDAGMQPIRWIGRQAVSAARLAANPNLQPIRIRAGALGDNVPATDLVVSPQHRVLVRSRIALRMFGTEEVLVAAKQLCQIDGIDIAHDLAEIVYVHFLFDDHQIVFSNGAETESLLVGAEALKSVGAAARAEILALFPDLAERGATPIRTLTSGRMGRQLAGRHLNNEKPLFG